ncbi:MAG: ferrous iron transport protein B [Oscillospiraceae bacterium]|nr:ferrous iron transport protein B [Oscillospiraceae bacterium]
MTLDQLTPGKSALIDTIDCEDISLRKHILDMGLTAGTEVTYVKEVNGAMEIRVRGYELVLREDDAKNIRISNVADGERVYRHPHAERLRKKVQHPGLGEHIRGKDLAEVIPVGAPITFGLIGNQNCGKTTLFNQLTGSNQHVGNFAGVTVERKDGIIRSHPEATITDLPGIYSLSPYTQEEIVTRDFVMHSRPDCIINILDASNLQRSLYLTTQLLSMEIPMVLALNMMDEVQKNGGTIDVNLMETVLGIPVIPISAAKNEGIDELIEHAIFVARHAMPPRRNPDPGWADPESDAIHRCIHAVTHIIEDCALKARICANFAATKLIEGDEPIQNMLHLKDSELQLVEKTVKLAEDEMGKDRLTAISEMRFRFINMLCARTVVYPTESIERQRSKRIDSVLTGRYTAVPSFIGIMAAVFYLTFGPVGSWFSDMFALFIDNIIALADGALAAYGINPVVHSLVIDGVMAGIGSVLSFLPVIVLLFFFLSLLEDSGYMSRVAFIMDGILRKIGLSGRSIVPMLIGFGCSVPAIMASRTLPSDRDRKMTILLTPFMSCSAKLPIYALFTAAFFPENGALVMLALYFGGILVGILFALMLRNTAFRGEPVPFVMELPNYRMPMAKNVLQLIGEKAKDFLTKAFTVIFLAPVIIWFLQTFDTRFNLVTDSSQSLLALVGGVLAPIFAPLGLGDWRISTALVTGFTAKESVVSTLLVLVGGSEASLSVLFTPATAAVFLTFCLLYTPCVAAIAAVKRELGGRWAALISLLQCVIAWIVSFAVAAALRAAGLM